ncbi:MAG: radical SAM protein [Nanoarchaeota archaeon]
MVRKVQLAQVNHIYGGNAWLPYSAGIVQANAMVQPDLKEDYKFVSPIFLRGDPSKIVAAMDNPNVVGISSYVWNWEWNKALAQEIRRQNPGSLIVMGGPQVPNWSDGFFQGHPYIDILVHGEGEITFTDILRERRKENPDYSQVRGITFNRNGVSVKTKAQERADKQKLKRIPSPYLYGIFDELMSAHQELGFNVTSETHRGCPYSCDFCDWGSTIYHHIEQFSDKRVKAEYDWIANHKIEFVYNADANFMLFPRDEVLIDYLIWLNQKTGYPKQLRANWAKNVHERIFSTAQKLNRAKMDMGITMALQSLHEKTLKAVHRTNIKHPHENYKRYKNAGIPTYTEIILPLPEETYETFVGGLEKLLEGGQHMGINIYQCMILPNSEMSHLSYIKRYGIQLIDSPILQNHSTSGTDLIQEKTLYAIATDAMPVEDFKKAYLFGWAIQGFHSLGLTQDIAIHLNSQGVSYRSFYEGLISENPETIVGIEVAETKRSLDKIISDSNRGQWGKINSKYGDISWPFEELSFLNIMTGDKERFYNEVSEMVKRKFGISIPQEVITGQMSRLRTPDEFKGDIKEYAKRVVWFGRKSGYSIKDY